MNIKATFLTNCAFAAALISASLLPITAHALTVVGEGSTFEINIGAGFDGAEGAQRQAAFAAAAKIWADSIISSIPIVVDIKFESLSCSENSATLGSAGPLVSYYPSGAEYYGLENNIWYPTALTNAREAQDYFTESPDITAQFNTNIGTQGCFENSGWYYGLDGNAPDNLVDFKEVAAHELGHGLGILSLVNSSGELRDSRPDIFTTFLFDFSTGKAWPDMNNAERLNSTINDGNLVWTGIHVNNLANQLTTGVNNGSVKMYAPQTYSSGSSNSHFDTTLSPDELMEPNYTGNASYLHSVALLKDIGWQIVETNDPSLSFTQNGQINIDEDSTFEISVSNLTITGAEPSDITVVVLEGENYSFNGLNLTPDANYNGVLNVPVFIQSGIASSDVGSIDITVLPINDAPLISNSETFITSEDTSITLDTNDIDIEDPDDNTFEWIIENGLNYSVLENTITPAANFNGTLNVGVSISDGEAVSNSITLLITVTPVNDAPKITGTPNITINEDNAHTFKLSDFTVTDIDSSAFELAIQQSEQFAVNGNTVTPFENENGALTITANISDSAGAFDTDSFTLVVNPVNDAPVIEQLPNAVINNDNSYTQNINASDIENDSLSFSVRSDHNWLEISSSGVLSGTPTNIDVGTQTVTVIAYDGELESEMMFDLTVADDNTSDAAIVMSADTLISEANSNLAFTVIVHNQGPAQSVSGSFSVEASDAIFSNNLPNNCTLTSASSIECDYTDIQISHDFDVEVTSEKAVFINAAITPTPIDPIASNNEASLSLYFAETITSPTNAIAFNNASLTSGIFGSWDDSNSLEWVALNESGGHYYQLNSSQTAVLGLQSFSTEAAASHASLIQLSDSTTPALLISTLNGVELFEFDSVSEQFIQLQTIGAGESLETTVADFNGDGLDDFVVATNEFNQLYLNDGLYDFSLSATFGISQPSAIGNTQANSDEYPDLITLYENSDDTVDFNNADNQTDGVFDPISGLVSLALTESSALAVLDSNNDGIENELAIGEKNANNGQSLTLYRMADGSSLSLAQFIAGDVVAIATGDIDANNDVDIAVLNSDGLVQIYLQEGDALTLEHLFMVEGANNLALQQIPNTDIMALAVFTDTGNASSLYLFKTSEEGNEQTTEENTEQNKIVVTSSGSFGFNIWAVFALLVSLHLIKQQRRVFKQKG